MNLSGRERKRRTTSAADRIIQRKIKADRRKLSSKAKREIGLELGVIIHINIVQNCLHEIDLKGLIAREKFYASKVNREKDCRLQN